MAAYAAVISLKHTINGLLNSSRTLPDFSREILKSAYDDTTSLQQALERLDDSSVRWSSSSSRERLDAFEGQIRDCAHKLEDILEYYELNSQEEKDVDEEVKQEITSFAETMKEMEKDCIQELSREDNDDDDAAIVSSNVDSGVDMVGHSSKFTTIRDHLLRRVRPQDTCFLSFFGENGSGRTMAAKTIFEDLCKGTKQFFDCCAWVTVGTIHQLKQGLTNILAYVDNLAAGDYELLISKEEEELCNCLYKSLENRRYMIVLDDVRDVQVVDYFRRSLPDQSNGSLVFLNTGFEEVAELADLFYTFEQTAPHSSVRWSSSSRERLDALEGHIRDCAHNIEDVLEFYALKSQEDKYEDKEVRQGITSFAQIVKKLEKGYIEELSSPVTDDDDAAMIPSNIDSDVEMVGSSHQLNEIRESLLRRMRPYEMFFLSLLGEEGSGRTVIARTIFDDLRKGRKNYFDCYAWMRTGNRPMKEVLIGIIVQVSKLAARSFKFLISKEVEFLSMYLRTFLEHRRYMIVLHDVRHVKAVNYWRMLLPDKSDGSLVILTTSSLEIAKLSDRVFDLSSLVPFMKESTWDLLKMMIFCTPCMRISPELEEVGRKIAENCRGLIISAVKILLFLSKSEKTVEQWRKIAADKENPIFKVADEVSEISGIETEIQSEDWDIYDDRIRHSFVEWILSFVENSVKEIRNKIFPERFFSKMQIISLLGTAGIGKSTLATKIFKDQSILRRFEHHVWVTLGPKYQTENFLMDILAQIYADIDKLHIKGDEKLARELCAQLSSKRSLIVLDDLWSQEPLHHLKKLLPDICGTTLVTTRLASVAEFGRDDFVWVMQLLDEEESWCLLCQKVFGGEGLCPPQLEKAGRKIAGSCDGLPLLIVKVAEELLKVSISEEYWNKVASGKEKSVFMNAHNRIFKILLPSYQRLPQHLKPCFLYMGVFREKYEIPMSKLTNLLIAEGFLETNLPQTVEDFIAECVLELLCNTLVMDQRKVSNLKIKTCRLHSVFWHLSNREDLKNRFFHAMNIYDDCSTESIQSQRRLCIRNSTLLGMKDVQISMASNASAHSLLCVNPLQQYPVPIIFGWRLLRVMNALTIRLYEFPVEVVRLVHLRYLGLTCNGNLPTSISNLWKLQCLIVKRYVHIKSSQNSWPLPAEIWDMKELQHLEVMGGCLPDHKCGAGLLKLINKIHLPLIFLCKRCM